MSGMPLGFTRISSTGPACIISGFTKSVCTVCLDKDDAVCDIVMPDDWSIRSMRIDSAEVSVRQSAVTGKHVEFTAVRNIV